jgi:opacity protein-like surface antigen
MKKLFTLLSVVALTASMSFAQTQYGAALGFNFANVSGSDVSDADMRLGIRIGLDMQRELSRSVNLHTGLLYSVKGYDFSSGGIDADQSLNYLEIPVNFGFVMSDNFSLMAGFYSAFLVGTTVTVDGQTISTDTDGISTIDFGLGFGAQVALSDAFSMNAGYQLGLSSIDDSGAGADVKNSTILIGACYTFGGGRY